MIGKSRKIDRTRHERSASNPIVSIGIELYGPLARRRGGRRTVCARRAQGARTARDLARDGARSGALNRTVTGETARDGTGERRVGRPFE